MPPGLTPEQPGVGDQWLRLAEAVRLELPAHQIDGVWVFRVIRRGSRDFGTAIVSRVEGDRRRIYTASFVHTVKGKKRGQFEAELAEVGSGPLPALEQLLALVPRRVDDEEPPIAIDPAQWFPPPSDAQAEQG